MTSSSQHLTRSVLSFWYELPPDTTHEKLETTIRGLEVTTERTKRWFLPDRNFDEQCTKDFKSALESFRTNRPDPVAFKDDQVSLLAHVILLDNLSRNIYRGSSASVVFSYFDPLALSFARLIPTSYWSGIPWVELFAFLPFEHSESLDNQKHLLSLLRDRSRKGAMYDQSLEYALEHISVIERFGRFPHRNAVLGRESSEEENAWLESEHKPKWAK
ncbi:DUF924-domain-containing protein [Atractiella rhizophila]|nr:DUF924-domain-containing protein [Atractiella rhizophila]